MGWKEVKRRVSLPILTPDGITAIIYSCLEKEGKNKKHSRSIVLDDYKSPVDDEESISEIEVEKIKFDIIRHMAQSLLRDCDVRDSSKTISQFMSRWKEKNSGLDITLGELQEITTMSDEDIRKSIAEKSENNICGFINRVYRTSCDLAGEHNGENPIYPFERPLPSEKNTLWGYNKRLYLNPSLKNISTYKFLAEYIKKCIDRRIPFDMKGFGSMAHSAEQLDGMILYSSNEYFDHHIECLEEVIKENPEIMRTFGSPIYTGARVSNENGDVYYTVGAGFPCTYRNQTYNDYIDSAINMTYLTSAARLIKQYFPLISTEYRKLDEETKTLINKLNSLEQCSAKELQRIELGFKDQKETIRELANKIITYKKEKGTKQEKEETMGKLKVTFSNNFKVICSALKFNDKEHINTPIYADGSFLDFEQRITSKDIAQADRDARLTTSEVSDAKNTMNRIVGKDIKNQEIQGE